MRIALSTSLAVAVAAAASPASGQSQPADTESSEVVVVGQANRDRAVRDYVKAITQVSSINPVGRFDSANVCPAAVGLSEAHNAAIAARMRRIAQAAGMPVAEPGCSANALVLFSNDKDELIEAFRKTFPAYFRQPSGQPVEIGRQPGPVTAWHLEQRIDRSGKAVGSGGATDVAVVSTPVVPSRISGTLRPVFVASVVVIEVDSIIGLSITQVADYAAMRSFAKTDPARLKDSSAPSILTVLEAPMDSEIPLTLTSWDMAYLKALYASVPTRFGTRQANEISRRINEELDEASSAAE